MSDNPAVEPADVFYSTTDEPELDKPTVKPVTEEVVQEPIQDVKTPEEPVKAEELETDDPDKVTQYLELDGKEYDLNEVRTWQKSTMMQSDYTKKTTSHAEKVKKDRAEIDSKRENLQQSQAKVDDMSVKLEALVSEDDAIDWVELKEDDPEEYIRLKEKADKRKELVEQIKTDRAIPADDPAMLQDEKMKFFTSDPDWLDDNNVTTEAYAKDMELLHGYVSKAGFSNEEFSRMTKSHYLTTILKAAKYDKLQEKSEKVRAKRETVPLVTKPTAIKTSGESKSMEEVFYGTP